MWNHLGHLRYLVKMLFKLNDVTLVNVLIGWKASYYAHSSLVILQFNEKVHAISEEISLHQGSRGNRQLAFLLTAVRMYLNDLTVIGTRELINTCTTFSYRPECVKLVDGYLSFMAQNLEMAFNDCLSLPLHPLAILTIKNSKEAIMKSAMLECEGFGKAELSFYVAKQIREKNGAFWGNAKWFVSALIGALVGGAVTKVIDYYIPTITEVHLK